MMVAVDVWCFGDYGTSLFGLFWPWNQFVVILILPFTIFEPCVKYWIFPMLSLYALVSETAVVVVYLAVISNICWVTEQM